MDLHELPNKRLRALCASLEGSYLLTNEALVATGFGDYTESALRIAYAKGETGQHSELVKRHLETGEKMQRAFREQIRRREAGTMR